MDELKKLQEKLAALVDKAKAFKAIEGLTDDQKAECDTVLADIKTTNADIVRTQAILDAEASVVPAPQAADAGTPVKTAAEDIAEAAAEAGTGHGAKHSEVAVIDPKVDFPTPFANIGEQGIAIIKAQKGNGLDGGLEKIMNAAASGQNEKVDSEGGFLVQKDIADGIDAKVWDTGEILSRVNRIAVQGNGMTFKQLKEDSRVDGSRHGGIQNFWVDEADEIADSKAKFRQLEMKLRKNASLVFVTDELLEDATALAGFLDGKMEEAITFGLENSIVSGGGAVKPVGYVGHNSNIVIDKEVGQGGNTIVFENISKMFARLWGRSRAKAVWLVNQDIEPELDNMSLPVGTGGVPVYMPANGISVGGFASLKGKPVITIEYAETLGTASDIQLVDLSQYQVIEKAGTKSASSTHIRFEFDEVAFKVTKRIDGQPLWAAPLTPFKGTKTQSPFITLETRP